jgi:alkylation response protein AidB-like acyl-CoA dehydrogenase
MLAAASEPAAVAAASLEEALAAIATTAAERDRRAPPRFPADAIALLRGAGALAFNASADSRRPPAADELALVRSVARADGSVGRIFDGHLNGVERLAVQGPPSLRDTELPAIAAGTLQVGVWGGDPRPGEGSSATIERRGQTERLSGVKTFCSGAGGLHRALVLARDPHESAAPVSAWVDLTDAATVEVDERWYRGAGLRASVSHRVVFHGAPLLARLGPPAAISRQPWFGRDALRTAASWAGMADRAFESGLAELATRPDRGPLEELAAGWMLTARHTIDAWLRRAAHEMDTAGSELPAVALHARVAIADACGTLLVTAARACGSHQFATAGELDRARRDLELFVLQHRLEPAVAAAGAEALRRREAPA